MRRSTTKRLWLAGSLALLAALLPAGCAEAEVKIKGYGVTEERTLDQIDDIVLWTTGSHDWPRNSFIECVAPSSSGSPLQFWPFRRNEKGTWDKGDIDKHDAGTDAVHYGSFGLHTAVGEQRRRDADGKDQGLTVMWPIREKQLRFARVKMNDNFKLTAAPQDVVIGTGYPLTDATGGLFPKGKYDRDNPTEWFTDLFLIANKDSSNNAYVDIVDPETRAKKSVNLGKMMGDHAVARVAAGDLDHDGKANEFAVVRGNDNADYKIEIYRVPADWPVSAPQRLWSGYLADRDDKAHEVDGCDVVIGDFDGDGKKEVAVVFADYVRSGSLNHHGYPAVATFAYDAGKQTFYQAGITRQSSLGSKDELAPWRVGHEWDKDDDKRPDLFGIVAEAGDVDGDGKDEIVFLCRRYVDWSESGNAQDHHGDLMLAVWGTDKDLKPQKKGGKCVFPRDVSHKDKAPYLKDHILKSASLALPFTGETAGMLGGAKRDILVSSSTKDSSKHKVLRLGYSAAGLSDLVQVDAPANTPCLKLLAGDFYYESLELDNPVHMIFKEELFPILTLQCIPYHVDWAALPYEIVGPEATGEKSLVNMTHRAGAMVNYLKSTSSSTETNVSHTTDTKTEWKVGGHIGEMVDNVLGFRIAGGWEPMKDHVEETVNSSLTKFLYAKNTAAEIGDAGVVHEMNRHVWRYPILTPVQPGEEVPSEASGGVRYMTYSLCDSPGDTTFGLAGGGSGGDDIYNAAHEEGNLFSYPTKASSTPGYKEKQASPLDGLRYLSFNAAGGLTPQSNEPNEVLTLDKSTVSTDTDSFQTTDRANASFTMNFGVPSFGFGAATLSFSVPAVDLGGFEAAFNGDWTRTDMTVSTKRYDTTEGFQLYRGAGGLPYGNVDHWMDGVFYVDSAGAMTTAFGVDLKHDTTTQAAWMKGGMYDQGKSDPALVLPRRFSAITGSDGGWTWKPNYNYPNATQLRGIRFKEKDTGKWASSCLAQDADYEVHVPLYNASFVDAGEVTVEMRLREHFSSADKEVLGRTTVKLGGWPNHRATAVFGLTSAKLSGLVPDNYDLWFAVDPSGDITELHEDWDPEKDPGGNNGGRYPIGVIPSRPMYISGDVTYYADGSSDDVKPKAAAAAATEGRKVEVWFAPIREDDARTRLTVAEFREELAAQTESFHAHGWAGYSGHGPLTNLRLTIAHLESDGTRHVIARRIVPALYPDREYPFSFMIHPSMVDDMNFVVNVSGSGVSLRWPNEEEQPTPDGGSSSGGGCSASGFGGLAALAVLGAALLKGRRRK